MSKKTWLTVALAGLALVSTSKAMASAAKVSTDGGFKVWHSDDGDKWFKFGGRMHIDQVFHMADKDTIGSSFGNSANVRRIRSKFAGGIGHNLSYVLETQVGLSGDWTLYQVGLNYAPSDNWWVMLGQTFPGYFGLENTRSSNATTFMEYNQMSRNYGPDSMLGVAFGYFTNGFSFNLSAGQPKHETRGASASDKIKYAVRGAYAPVYTDTTVYHVGGSFSYENLDHQGQAGFLANGYGAGKLGVKGKKSGDLTSAGSFRARNLFVWEVDAAVTLCSWNLQAQYWNAKFGRRDSWNTAAKAASAVTPILGDVTFKGYWAETSYILTGETLTYGEDGGYFNGVSPERASGAWQVGVRYDYANFMDKEITGGAQRNLTFALNYYYNDHMRVMLSYDHAKALDVTNGVAKGDVIGVDAVNNGKVTYAAEDGNPRDLTLHSLGARLQITF